MATIGDLTPTVSIEHMPPVKWSPFFLMCLCFSFPTAPPPPLFRSSSWLHTTIPLIHTSQFVSYPNPSMHPFLGSQFFSPPSLVNFLYTAEFHSPHVSDLIARLVPSLLSILLPLNTNLWNLNIKSFITIVLEKVHKFLVMAYAFYVLFPHALAPGFLGWLCATTASFCESLY